jgi:hypothetical protein
MINKPKLLNEMLVNTPINAWVSTPSFMEMCLCYKPLHLDIYLKVLSQFYEVRFLHRRRNDSSLGLITRYLLVFQDLTHHCLQQTKANLLLKVIVLVLGKLRFNFFQFHSVTVKFNLEINSSLNEPLSIFLDHCLQQTKANLLLKVIVLVLGI